MFYGKDIIFYDIGITFYKTEEPKPKDLFGFPNRLEEFYY